MTFFFNKWIKWIFSILFLIFPLIGFSQNNNINDSRVEIVFLYLGIAVLFVLAFLTLMAFLQKRRTTQKLDEQNALIAHHKRELKRAHKEFLKQNHELETVVHQKNSIVNVISHDLKRPFNRILGLANLLTLDGGDQLSDSQQQYIDMMKQVVQDGLFVIQNLIDSRVIEDYRREINIERIDLVDCIQKVVKRYQNYATSKKINLRYTHPDTIEYRTDHFFITRIMDNLISNAIKFSPPERNVDVRIKENPDNIHIEVKDEGFGIPDEDKENIFLQHKTYCNKPTGGESNAGVGLYVVQKMVEELNGKIWFDTKVGVGTNFYVEFEKKNFDKF